MILFADNGTVSTQCSITLSITELGNDDNINPIVIIVGFLAGLVVMVAVAILLILLWWQVGFPCLRNTRLPPPKGMNNSERDFYYLCTPL